MVLSSLSATEGPSLQSTISVLAVIGTKLLKYIKLNLTKQFYVNFIKCQAFISGLCVICKAFEILASRVKRG